MPQNPVDNERMSLRIPTDEKALLIRAAALKHTNLTEFVLRAVMSAARKVIDENERIEVSEKDFVEVLNLIENPPAPNKKLLAAAYALPKR